jgi:hypothetical protein
MLVTLLLKRLKTISLKKLTTAAPKMAHSIMINFSILIEKKKK